MQRIRSDDGLERAYASIVIKSFDDDARVFEGIASTPTPDIVDDIVEPLGADFKLPLPLLWQHNAREPIGEVFYAKPTKSGIPFKARIFKATTSRILIERLDEAWESIKIGLVKAVSIGFRAIEHSTLENGGWRFLKWRWLELSAVTIPANQDATIDRIRSIDRQLRGASATLEIAGRKTLAGVAAKPKTTTGVSNMKTISEQISALEATLEQKKALAASIQEKATNEGRTKDENEQEQFNDAVAAAGGIKQEIDDLKSLEMLGVAKAKPVVKADNSDDSAKSRSNEKQGRTTVIGPNTPKGVAFVRFIKCLYEAKGSTEVAALLAEKHYPDDKRIANYARLPQEQKAAVGAAYTAGSGWADALASANLIGDFLELLRHEQILSKFGQDGVPGFRPAPFNVKIPRQTAGGAANWVGQAKPIPVSKDTFDQVTMGITKIAAMTYASQEQMQFSAVNAESVLLNDLVANSAEKADQTFFSAAAASAGVSPAGIVNGISALATAGVDFDDIIADLTTLRAPMIAAKIKRAGIVLVTNEDLAEAIEGMTTTLGVRVFPEVAEGRLRRFPLLSSGNIAAGDFFMIAAPQILMADGGGAEVSMSDQASIEALDGSLVQDGQAGTGASLVSFWQTDTVGIRVKRQINWQKGNAGAAQWIGTAGYGGAASA